jgi:hypothetical protein
LVPLKNNTSIQEYLYGIPIWIRKLAIMMATTEAKIGMSRREQDHEEDWSKHVLVENGIRKVGFLVHGSISKDIYYIRSHIRCVELH